MNTEIDWESNEQVLAIGKTEKEKEPIKETISDIYIVFSMLYQFSKIKPRFTLVDYFNWITKAYPFANITKERVARILYELSMTFLGTSHSDGKDSFWVAYKVSDTFTKIES